jgi:hypothetical protein
MISKMKMIFMFMPGSIARRQPPRGDLHHGCA